MIARIVDRVQEFRKALARRPTAVFGAMVGAFLFAAAQPYLIVTQPLQQRDINHNNQIRHAFCSGKNPNGRLCSDLLDALLDSATPAQEKRIRDIVGGRR